MNDPIDWRALRAQGQTSAEKLAAEAASKSSVSRDWFSATISAARWSEQDELTPAVDEYGGTRYSIQQGLKAACHAREDVAATLVVQHSVLRRLQGLRMLAWACLAVLVYIAIRVS